MVSSPDKRSARLGNAGYSISRGTKSGWSPALTRDPELQDSPAHGPAVLADLPVRHGDVEGPRERGRLQADVLPVFPHELEPPPVELEPVGRRRRVPRLPRPVQEQVQREPVAQPQKAEVALQVIEVNSGHTPSQALLACRLPLDEPDRRGV